MRSFPSSPGFIAQLKGLTNLHTLYPDAPQGSEQQIVDCICRLTGLRRLDIAQYCDGSEADGLMLKLTQLRQLIPYSSYCVASFNYDQPQAKVSEAVVSTHAVTAVLVSIHPFSVLDKRATPCWS